MYFCSVHWRVNIWQQNKSSKIYLSVRLSFFLIFPSSFILFTYFALFVSLSSFPSIFSYSRIALLLLSCLLFSIFSFYLYFRFIFPFFLIFRFFIQNFSLPFLFLFFVSLVLFPVARSVLLFLSYISPCPFSTDPPHLGPFLYLLLSLFHLEYLNYLLNSMSINADMNKRLYWCKANEHCWQTY